MKKHVDFVHLHVHTQYSLLDGANPVSSLLDRAAQLQMPALAITDHGNLFGAVEFYQKAHAAGVKPIIGCEMYVAPKSRLDKEPSGPHNEYNHLILLARDNTGYRNHSSCNYCNRCSNGCNILDLLRYLKGVYHNKPFNL